MTKVRTTLIKADDEALKSWLQGRLNEERYQHSLGTWQKAAELARYFGLSPEEAEKTTVAGLLHDCAKLMPVKSLFEACEKLHVPLSEDDRKSPQTLHPLVGAEIVREEFQIEDPEILNAIRYHSTGRSNMSNVEKVVFTADKIEENTRNPLYIQKITSLINSRDKETLDKVVLYILNSTITFLIERGEIIHPRTIEARNELVSRDSSTLSTKKRENSVVGETRFVNSRKDK